MGLDEWDSSVLFDTVLRVQLDKGCRRPPDFHSFDCDRKGISVDILGTTFDGR